MTEIKPRPEENQPIDSLLRRSMAAPVPVLPSGFDQRVLRTLRRDVQPHVNYHRKLLAAYGLASVLVSAAVMHGQGLSWGAVAASILAPLVLVAAARSLRLPARATDTSRRAA